MGPNNLMIQWFQLPALCIISETEMISQLVKTFEKFATDTDISKTQVIHIRAYNSMNKQKQYGNIKNFSKFDSKILIQNIQVNILKVSSKE